MVRHRFDAKLRQVIYRTDATSMMLNVNEANRAHMREQRRQEFQALKHISAPQAVTYESILSAAMMDHFQVVAHERRRAVFTLLDCPDEPRSDITSAHSVGSMMTVHQRRGDIAAMAALDADIAEHPGDIGDAVQPCVFFRIVKAQPSRWHTVPMSRAAGSKLRSLDMAVTLHRGNLREGVVTMPLEPSAASDPVTIIRGLGGQSIAALRTNLLTWTPSGSLVYSINSFRSELVPNEDVHAVLTEFVRLGAFPLADNAGRQCYSKRDSDLDADSNVVDELRDAGYVESISHDSETSQWVLTAAALAELRLQERINRC